MEHSPAVFTVQPLTEAQQWKDADPCLSFSLCIFHWFKIAPISICSMLWLFNTRPHHHAKKKGEYPSYYPHLVHPSVHLR
jgi:hypothetical protein